MKRFPYGHATHRQWRMAADVVLTQLRAQMRLPGYASEPTLALLYITDHYGAQAQDILDHMSAELPEITDWSGTVGVGIAANNVEYFDEPAMAVMLLDLPSDQYRVFSGVAPLGLGFEAHTALIHAAAGGTGALLVQMAKLRGARVIGTVGSAEKAALAKEAGADDVIIYTQTDFETEVKELTDGKGVNVVYDSVGKDTFMKSLNCLRPRGYMVLFGQASGRVEPFDPQILNQKGSLYLTRPTLGVYIATRDEFLQRAGDLFNWMANGKLDVRIDKTFPLADAADAHRYLEGRNTKGKVLLLP